MEMRHDYFSHYALFRKLLCFKEENERIYSERFQLSETTHIHWFEVTLSSRSTFYSSSYLTLMNVPGTYTVVVRLSNLDLFG